MSVTINYIRKKAPYYYFYSSGGRKRNSFYLTNSLVICSLDTGCSESCSIGSYIVRHIQSVGTKQVIGHVERVHSQSSRISFLILQHPLFFLPSSFISTANDDESLTFAEILEPDNQSLVNNVNSLVRFRQRIQDVCPYVTVKLVYDYTYKRGETMHLSTVADQSSELSGHDVLSMHHTQIHAI